MICGGKRKYNKNNCYNVIKINSTYSIKGSYDKSQHVKFMDLNLV